MSVLTGEAPSTGFGALQTALHQLFTKVEQGLEKERAHLPLWVPVSFGLGIALWFGLPVQEGWIAIILCGLALAVGGAGIGLRHRLGMALLVFGLMTSAGVALVWTRAAALDHNVLARPLIAEVTGRIERVEPLVARDQFRLTVTQSTADLPQKMRVTLARDDAPEGLVPGQDIRFKARLMPPASPTVPGAHDFARVAWFQQIGASGKILGRPTLIAGAVAGQDMRAQLSTHITDRASSAAQGIAVSLATGNQGFVSEEDQEAMRTSGLAHLLSISGLHITAVVAAAMLLTLRLMALSPRLALHWNLPLLAGAAGALAAIAYTWLAGAEVPTIRSCIAALLVMAALALGREAMTLRLVGAGALIVLIFRPESLVGPSFQLSFAAIAAIVAFHEHPRTLHLLQRREESWLFRLGRLLFGLLLTGLVVELALAPIALFHFHKSGLYGALANIVAIPFTTFIIMPLEALALLFDVAGLGAPFWWLASRAIEVLLWLAHSIADLPGAVAMLPSIPVGAYALMIAGGLWVILWLGRFRWLGFLPFACGCLWALLTPAPDLLITDDGRHVAIRDGDGTMAILRPKAGDYVRNILAERSGSEELADVEGLEDARCSPDVCVIDMKRGERLIRVMATRTSHFLPWRDMIATCAASDIVISDRTLPKACQPRWFRADRATLAKTGGLALTLSNNAVESVRLTRDDHPWRKPPPPIQYRRNSPANVP